MKSNQTAKYNNEEDFDLWLMRVSRSCVDNVNRRRANKWRRLLFKLKIIKQL